MKFSASISVLALAAGVLAEQPTRVKRDSPTLVERDVATISSVIADVDTGIKNLDTAVKAFTGDVTAVQKASMSLLNTIKAGTTTIKGTTEITLQETVTLQTFVTTLQGDGQSLVTDLQAKKSAFEKAALCDVVRLQISDISTGGKALIDAIVSKVPQAAQSIAAQVSSGFTATLAQSESSFAAGNCTNAASGTGSGGGAGGGSSGNKTTTTTSPPRATVTAAGAAVNGVGGSVGMVAIAVAAMML